MKFATFDIEAYKWVHLKTIGFFDGQGYHYFTDINDFLDFILTKRYRSYTFFAHFGGGFDFRFILPALVSLKTYKLRMMERSGKVFFIKATKNKHTWKFLDSYFLLPQSQKKLAESFSVKHQKKDIDFLKIKESDFYKKDMVERLRYDTVGLYEIIDKYKDWGLNKGVLKNTLASQSLHIFKTKFLKEKIGGLNDEQENFIRRAYFGGRTEIIRTHGYNLKYYDINSLYPYVMCNDMPCGSIVGSSRFIKGKIGFYRADIYMPYMKIPFIPIVRDKKLIFAYGRFEAYVTSADLELCQRLGVTFKVKDGYYFSHRKKIFKSYIEKMYELKKNSKVGSMDYVISKLMMNALYGKFGQRRENEEIIIPESTKEILDNRLIPYFEELDIYKREVKSKSKYILPHLSCYITSLARLKLYEEMGKVGFEHIYYCDTDSIISDKRISCHNGLGGWKCERDNIKEAVFIQPKCYALKLNDGKEVIKIKGIPDHNFTFSDFKKALLTDDLSLLSSEYEKIAGFRESLVRFKSLTIRRIKIKKILKQKYNKRIVDKFDSQPYNASNFK